MQKILLMVVAVVLALFSANGAEQSATGLEGIGVDGVKVVVESYGKNGKKTAKSIQKQIELRLLQAGMKLNPKLPSGYIYVNPHTQDGVTYYLTLQAHRDATFSHVGKAYKKLVPVWSDAGFVGSIKLGMGLIN